MKKNSLKKKFAFTLIELLVTITVMIILSSMVFVGKTKSEKKLAVERGVFVLAANIRAIQEEGMSARKLVCPSGVTYQYGIYFNKVSLANSYLLFGDCNKNKNFDSEDLILREEKLEKNVFLSELKVDGISKNSLTIIVLPPEPTIFIDGKEWGASAEISLSLSDDPNWKKKIIVNSAGAIEIQ